MPLLRMFSMALRMIHRWRSESGSIVGITVDLLITSVEFPLQQKFHRDNTAAEPYPVEIVRRRLATANG